MWTLGLAEEETFQDSIIWMAWRWYCSKKEIPILSSTPTTKVKRRMEHNFFFRGWRNFHWNWIIFHHVKRQSVKNPINQINWPLENYFILQKTVWNPECTWTCMVKISDWCWFYFAYLADHFLVYSDKLHVDLCE